MDEPSEPEELSRSEMRAVRGLVHRQDWGLPEDVRTRILRELVHLIDPESEAGAKASSRTRIAAAKTVAALMKLGLGQQALDLAREKLEGHKAGEVDLGAVLGEAARLAEERRRERTGG